MSVVAPVLFESSDTPAVLTDPANADWVAVVDAVRGERYEVLARRYYVALYHFRTQRLRPQLPGRSQIVAPGEQRALQGMLALLEERKANRTQVDRETPAAVFIHARPDSTDESLPEVLRDFSKAPPPVSAFLSGPGRPPIDALCLMRAYLAAPLLGVGDDPTSVYRLLRSNPTFARACGVLGPTSLKQPWELTSRTLPSLSVCEEFSEVMTRYGLWHLARLDAVRENLASGVVCWRSRESAEF